MQFSEEQALKDFGDYGGRKIWRRYNDVPEVYRATYLKAVYRKSRPAATKAFCLECVGWQRREVTLCTAPCCPLFHYRPYQNSRKKKAGADSGIAE